MESSPPPVLPLTQLEIEPGVVLDARRAVWFAREEVLAVADLHLGYAWASRAAGHLLPLETPDDTLSRLRTLAQEFGARQLLVLGDIVHRAVSLVPVREELLKLHAALGATGLRLLGGNHDRGLPRLLRECGLNATLETHAHLGPHLLLHGDAVPPEGENAKGGRTFFGHEHPAIRIGDRISSVKCPCFLVGPRLVVLPAFSTWAAGSDVRTGVFLSPLAVPSSFRQAVAILAGKLLPVRL